MTFFCLKPTREPTAEGCQTTPGSLGAEHFVSSKTEEQAAAESAAQQGQGAAAAVRARSRQPAQLSSTTAIVGK